MSDLRDNFVFYCDIFNICKYCIYTSKKIYLIKIFVDQLNRANLEIKDQ